MKKLLEKFKKVKDTFKKSDILTKIIIVNAIIFIIILLEFGIAYLEQRHFDKTHVYDTISHSYIPREEYPLSDFQ